MKTTEHINMSGRIRHMDIDVLMADDYVDWVIQSASCLDAPEFTPRGSTVAPADGDKYAVVGTIIMERIK